MMPPMPARRRLLLVDDDPMLLALLSTVLQHAGYDTLQAASAEEALPIARQEDPDLALLDVNLPGMSGLDLAARLTAETAVPFMFLSVQDAMETVKKATAHGAVGYLVKPIDAVQVAPAVEAALARADDIRRLRRSEANLTAALAAGRETSMAVGMLMTRFKTDRDTAFEVLREYARARRCKINEISTRLLDAEEFLNSLHQAFRQHGQR
ncbi:MAG TPA: response regulator [Noviherbaspirillum sp.]|uniref:ANTAR domain-containing response regulator n=1 Tax=Noviherbaspirillum sp. TaxID=1926288 RepID=UPI002F9565FA